MCGVAARSPSTITRSAAWSASVTGLRSALRKRLEPAGPHLEDDGARALGKVGGELEQSCVVHAPV